jgi:hypothetical protein
MSITTEVVMRPKAVLEDVENDQALLDELRLAHEALAAIGHDVVLLVDRDGVVFQDPLLFANRRYPGVDLMDLTKKQVPGTALNKNSNLIKRLRVCFTFGIKICPASRSDWLNAPGTPSSEILTELFFYWHQFMDREFPNHPTITRAASNQLQVEDIGPNPFFIFISDDFGPDEISRGEPLDGLIQLLIKEFPTFNPRNFKVIQVESFDQRQTASVNGAWTKEGVGDLTNKIIKALQS